MATQLDNSPEFSLRGAKVREILDRLQAPPRICGFYTEGVCFALSDLVNLGEISRSESYKFQKGICEGNPDYCPILNGSFNKYGKTTETRK